MFDIYKNKKVLVTGHTGFKGSWLVAWLKLLGANVVGIANNQTSPSLYQSTGLANLINDIQQDICDLEALKKILENEKPDFVFHLAAQALVRESYIDPITTWKTNLVGTVNILESLRVLKKKCTAILITSDKCYDNVEWVWGYREHDRLGGPDPYSASKGAAELAINSYKKSFFNDDSSITICSARAGNVIGGGDWSKDRIIPDCVRAWANKEKVILRNPGSTRPWQHVLEPLSGYLLLGSLADNDKKLNGHSFNFGPNTNEDLSVLNVVKEMSNYWDDVSWDINKDQAEFYESGLLKLNCDKARSMLGWEAILDLQDTIRLTANWYKSFYEDEDMSIVTSKQINEFTELSNIKIRELMNSLISISNANKITNPNGDIFKLLSTKDTGFNGFGEAYISLIDYGAVKAWKRHNKMTMNLLVPFGNVAFVFMDLKGNFETVIIGESNFKRLTVPPGIWFGFKGISNQQNVVINIADFVHDDSEVDKAKVNEFDYDWDKL